MIKFKWQIILGIIELANILLISWMIYSEYSRYYSSFRIFWSPSFSIYFEPLCDLIVIGIFVLRISQIVNSFYREKTQKQIRRNLLFIILVYLIVQIPEFYSYCKWFTIIEDGVIANRFLLILFPLLIWGFRILVPTKPR